ncbi:MAG: sigma-54-dependent Fis family transcriptional regulator [Planctomycetes bacterium]|nr:sigma-54-dependent Fis family transcriptional regulator [Planctomycetota bacterium]
MILHRVVVLSRKEDIHQLARQVGRELFVAETISEASDITERINPELILFDHRFSPDCIREFLNTSDKNSNTYIVVIGEDQNNIYPPDQFISMGAHYYLHGKQDYHLLQGIVNQIQNKLTFGTQQEDTDTFFADDFTESVSMVGRSQAALHTLKMIKLVAASQCSPILIVGETGTGKEVAAKAIHTLKNPKELFVAVNCAALTANLLESELFGHVKGSFTSADREKTGLLELAGAGTIFLDEISEMPIDLQAKLLRVLQEKTFRKVGGTKEISCKATIIVSSNRNLKNEVQANRFRMDLYYRLNIFPITITPLRAPERKKDIPLLIQYFLKTSTVCPGKTNKITSITKLAIEALLKHDWPGNIRELHNVIERAILLETTDKIGLSSIVIDPGESDQFADNARADKIKDFSLAKAERELIARALQETFWQKTRAAEMLGISRATLYAKVKQYNIKSGSSAAKDQDEISALSLPEPLMVG